MYNLDGCSAAPDLLAFDTATFNSKACQDKAMRPGLSIGNMRPMAAKGFGDRVRKLREAKGLSQGDVERATGRKAGGGYLSNIETGGRDKRPSSDLVEALVVLTGVSRAWLLEGTGAMFDEPGPAPPAPSATATATRRRIVEEEDQFSTRAEFVALLGDAADEHAVSALRKHKLATGTDPGRAYWAAQYEELIRLKRKTLARLRSIGDELEDDADDE